MKKLIITIIILVVMSFLGYFIYTNYIEKRIPKLKIEEGAANISQYYIYGNHLNIKGTLEINDKNYKDISLLLYNGEHKNEKIIADVKENIINFSLSEYINEGLYIDDLERGTYFLFLKLTYENTENEEKPIIKYYALKNNTKYDNIDYYPLSKYNNVITINSVNDYNTMCLNVKENKSTSEIADITIDPGHGGMDGGGSANGYKETDFTLDLSKEIKSKLEKLGLKIKLTYEEGELTKNDLKDEYNKNGRAVISNEVKSKYTFSIHINKNTSSRVSGLEIYTPANINYDLAKLLATNINSYTGLNYSSNKINKMYDGVYTHNFSESEIASSLEEYDKKGYNHYEVTTNSNYLYMIRETGGIVTGAYVDDSNKNEVGENPYYDSNIGNETYLLELGYISNTNDLNNLIDKKDLYVDAIVASIKEELEL